MATYRSDKGGLNFVPRNRPEGALIAEPFVFANAATYANGDIFICGQLPKDSTLIGYTIDMPAVDTNAAPTAKLGIGTSANSILLANTAVTNGAIRLSSFASINSGVAPTAGQTAASLPVATSSAVDFRITITNALATAGTFTANTITGTYFYTMQPFYSDPKL